MSETGRAAIFKGPGQPMEIKEYPVPDPEPGAILIKVTVANLCGSDLHQWRGDIDLAASRVRLPAIIGHEMTGRVAKLGRGISTDSAGQKPKTHPTSQGTTLTTIIFDPTRRFSRFQMI